MAKYKITPVSTYGQLSSTCIHTIIACTEYLAARELVRATVALIEKCQSISVIIAFLIELISSSLSTYTALLDIPVPKLVAPYPRDLFKTHRPSAEENPYNAWYLSIIVSNGYTYMHLYMYMFWSRKNYIRWLYIKSPISKTGATKLKSLGQKTAN